MDAQIVGERIAKLRKSHSMTQKQLADELSVTYKAVSKWETGAGLPDIAMLPALASALNVSVDEIISGSSNDDHKKENHNKNDSQVKTARRYIRKPVVIMMSSLIFAFTALVALVIIFITLRTNGGLNNDESTHVHLNSSSGFGTSADHAKDIYDMQLASNIRTQLLQHNHIDDAVVIVATAVDSPFRLNQPEAKVSVILTIAETYTLSDIDMQTIETLIKSSVPSIKDENISIT